MDRKNVQAAFLVFVLILVVVLFILKAREHVRAPAEQGQNDSYVQLTMGNPSGATDDESDRDNFLMRKPYYALSYNNSHGAPNWVSWRLKEGDFGHAKRADQFSPDSDLPRAFKHVTSHDYTDSGFDRGHMCPRSDRTSTQEAADATFVMTNIIPQSPNCNQKAWADLEEYCRGLVTHRHRTLYIVSGPQGRGGVGKKGPAEIIGRAKVVVPAKCWKVVMALEDGSGGPSDIERVNAGTRLIAVVMPNDQSIDHGWAKYRTSVREVESLTGYKFFDRVPAEIIDPLKAKTDDERIPTPRRPRMED